MKAQKSEVQIAAEKREAEELVAEILSMTSRIPKKIMDAASINGTRLFKQQISKARAIASQRNKNLAKLREAHSLIRHYYA